MTSRCWCFTLNNPDGLLDFDDFCDGRYLVYQMELAPTTNTPHFQGYVEFSRSKRLAAVRRILDSAHWEPRRKTRDEARAYCMKIDTRIDGPYEHGSWENGGQGSRSDLYDMFKLVKDGKSELEILETMPQMWFRYHNAVNKAKLLIESRNRRTWKTEVHVILGPPRTGKSKLAMDMSPEAYWKTQDNWWDTFKGTEDVILDEFAGWLKFTDLLRLMDRYPMQVQNKGGFVNFAPKRIFITSNYHPWDWYKNEKIKYNMTALYERVEHWYWVEKDQEPQHFANFAELEAIHFPLIRD